MTAHMPAESPLECIRGLLGDPRAHVSMVSDRLIVAYGYDSGAPSGDPVGGLVATILSQHTSDANSGRAFQNLRHRYPTWEDVVFAEPRDIEDAIRSGGLAAQKAPRIQAALRAILEQFGGFDLSVLSTLPRDQARTLLIGLASGIGYKTASCVLLFDVGLPAFCVDTHIQRIAARIGFIRPNDSAERAMHFLEATIQPGDTRALHVAMIKHGRQVCRARRPRCATCPLLEICVFGLTETFDSVAGVNLP
jgi:endonuclease-3